MFPRGWRTWFVFLVLISFPVFAQTPEIRVCNQACGGSFPNAVGGWQDTDVWTDYAYGSACAGAQPASQGAITSPTSQGSAQSPTYICSSVLPQDSLVKVCQNSCGGSHPYEIGSWVDTIQVLDIAFGPGCSGTLQVPYAPNILVSKICGKQPLLSGNIKVCQSSCDSSTVMVGGYLMPPHASGSNLGSGCSGSFLLPPFETMSVRIFCQNAQSSQCSATNPCPSGQSCVAGNCVSQCSSTNPCPSGQSCVGGQCQSLADLDGNEQACQAAGYDWENFSSSNACCGDDNFLDSGLTGPTQQWLCFNQGGSVSASTISGGAWEWMRAQNIDGGLIDDEPNNKTYLASNNIWRSCALNPSPYVVAGSDYLCFDPSLLYVNGPLDKRLLLRIDYFSCGPYGNSGPVCGQAPYNVNNGDNLLHLFSRNKQLLGSFSSVGSNNYVLPLNVQNSVSVKSGEVFEYFGETYANVPGEAGSAAITLIYQRSSGSQQTLSYAAQNSGATFTFPEDGTLIFPTGSSNLYGAHVAVFLNVDEPPSVLNSNQEKSIAACCGNNLAGCSALINGQLRGGTRKSTGQSVDASGQRFFCTTTGRWITDLDTVASQGDPTGLTCDAARYPNGGNPQFGWTGVQCCGDDGNESFNDPGPNNAACFQGHRQVHCGAAFGTNNVGLVQNGIVVPCTSSLFCNRACNLTAVCTTNAGWAATSAGTSYNLTSPPPSALGYLLVAYAGSCASAFPAAVPVCSSTPLSNVLRIFGRSGQVLATVSPVLPNQYQPASPLQIPVLAADQLFFTATSGILTFKYKNSLGLTLTTFGLTPSSSNSNAPVFTFPQAGYIEFEAGVLQTGVSTLVIRTTAVTEDQNQCCANGGCFNGNVCLPNQASQVNVPPSGGSYRCINGGWTLASDKKTPFGMIGYCDLTSKCLYSELNGGVVANLNNTITSGVTCVNEGSFVEDDRCVNGQWSTRTSLLLQIMLGAIPANVDFVAYCDSPAAVLNNLNVVTLSGSPFIATLSSANDVCVLKTADYIYFGTSLNAPISENGVVLDAFGVSPDACDTLGAAQGSVLRPCSLATNAFYDPNNALFVYALPHQSASITPLFGNTVSAQMITSTWWNLMLTNILSYPTSFDFSGSLDLARFDRVYVAKKGTKFVAGAIENPLYGPTEYVRLHFTGFGSTNLCEYVQAIDSREQSNGFPSGYNVVYCDSSVAILSRDLVNVPQLGLNWQAGDIWQPLSSMLRMEGSN